MRRAAATLAALAFLAAALGAGRVAASDGAAFDAALRDAFLTGSGVTPEAVDTTLSRLRALVPAEDAVRIRRLDGLACIDAAESPAEGLAKAEALIERERDEDGDALALALAHACRSAHLPDNGPVGPQIETLGAAVRAAREAGDDAVFGQLLVQRSGAYSLHGESAKALIDALAAQDAFERAGEGLLAALNRQFVGIAYRRMGDHARAEAILRASLDDPAIGSNWVHAVTAQLQLGYLYDETARPEAARRAFGEALRLCEANDSPLDCAYAHLGLAGVDAANGYPERALDRLDAASAAFARTEEPPDEATADWVRAQALSALGRHAEALASVERAIARWREEDNARYLALALPARAAALSALGRHEEAARDWRELVTLQAADHARRSAQRTELMREQFESRQREIENAELRAREQARLDEIAALQTVRRWQGVAIGLAALLLAALGTLALRQRRLARRMRRLAATDALTAVPNRRALLDRGAVAFAEARRAASDLAVLAIDIDHFKRVNDGHGHAAGDAVLMRVALECQRGLRRNDAVGRIGGEEFVALLPGADRATAMQIAERLRAGVAGLPLDDLAPGLRATISVGVAELRAVDADFGTLLARADAAMYRAKQAGRNRVVSDETA